jgi:glycerophosphoryl diester phosphodiesterase
MAVSVAPNPWLERRVFHWAHQGGAKEAPSNTLDAMDRACAVGADGLEAYELRGEAAKNADLSVPVIDDVLDRFGHLPMTIEVKDEKVAEPLVAVLRAHQISFHNLIVTSFSDAIVDRLHRCAPDLRLAPGGRWTFFFYLRCRLFFPTPKRAPFVALQVPHRRPLNEIPQIPSFIRSRLPDRWTLKVTSPRLVQRAHRADLAVHVWTIDAADEMRELIAMGVDGIMTDRPSVLAGVLAEQQPTGL